MHSWIIHYNHIETNFKKLLKIFLPLIKVLFSIHLYIHFLSLIFIKNVNSENAEYHGFHRPVLVVFIVYFLYMGDAQIKYIQMLFSIDFLFTFSADFFIIFLSFFCFIITVQLNLGITKFYYCIMKLHNTDYLDFPSHVHYIIGVFAVSHAQLSNHKTESSNYW